MPNLQSNDDLYYLIHQLTPKEKEYFQKSMARTRQKESAWLQLFVLLSKQSKYNEQAAKVKFKNYKVLKVQLKDMIGTAMVNYHRKLHPHVEVMDLLQKSHFFVSKGMYEEAGKYARKATEQAKRIENFALTDYALRNEFEIYVKTFSDIHSLTQLIDQHNTAHNQNIAGQQELNELEALHMQWFLKGKTGKFDKPELPPLIHFLQHKTTQGKLAEIKRLGLLDWLLYLNGDYSKSYELTKQQLLLAEDFKTNHDGSYYSINAYDNHLLNCIDVKEFDEMVEVGERMKEAEKLNVFHAKLAFAWSTLHVGLGLCIAGRYARAYKLLKSNEAELLKIFGYKHDALGNRALRVYYNLNLLVLLTNNKLTEAWEAYNLYFAELKKQKPNISVLCIIGLMIQYELGNYSLLKSMVAKTQKMFSNHKLTDRASVVMLGFFKNVHEKNRIESAKHCLLQFEELNKDANYKNEGVYKLLRYEDWLTAIVRNRSLSKVVQERHSAELQLL